MKEHRYSDVEKSLAVPLRGVLIIPISTQIIKGAGRDSGRSFSIDPERKVLDPGDSFYLVIGKPPEDVIRVVETRDWGEAYWLSVDVEGGKTPYSWFIGPSISEVYSVKVVSKPPVKISEEGEAKDGGEKPRSRLERVKALLHL